MADIISETAMALQETAARYSGVLVSYSGGKDSLATLDMLCRAFAGQLVVAFHMYLVPGLACVEERLDFARQRWGVQVLSYPHWLLAQCLKHGVYSPTSQETSKIPDYTLNDVYAMARADTDLTLLANGIKKSDSEFRRKNVAAFQRQDVFCPLADWNKLEILAYLNLHNIPVPKGSSGNATGIDLSEPSLLWLHDNYPDDFRKLLEVFPYAECVVWRRHFFGTRNGKTKTPQA